MAKRLQKCCVMSCLATALAAAAPPRVAAQAGSEATQFFGRGFELDFGTDFALGLDGLPLNTPSHVRGPGYLDTGILIPELVEGCRYSKGPYEAGQGAFAVAGSASLALAAPPAPFLALTYGGADRDRTARILWADHLPGPRLTYALDFARNERPWDDLLGSARFRAALRREGEGPLGRWAFTVLGTEDQTDGGAAVPSRPETGVEDAKAGDGAWNQRLLLGWRLDRDGGPGVTTRVGVYAGAHHERIWNNWTFYLRDPVHGDQLEQVDRRVFLGGELARTWASGPWIHTLGFEARADHVTAAEVQPTQDRERLGSASPIPGLSARADLLHGALYGQSALRWGGGWEAFAGLRLDGQHNRIADAAGAWADGTRTLVLGSPRAGVSFSPAEGTLFALKAGQGFRPGDAFRGDRAMTRARSADFSAQTRPLPPWTFSVTLWRLDLESEALFEPLQNAFTGRGPARHQGVELYQEIIAGPWRGELAWGWNRSWLTERPRGLDRVPGAVPESGYAGVGWTGGGFGVDLRLRHTGRRPLTADGSVEAGRQEAIEARVERSFASWTVAFEVVNAFTRKTYNHEFFYASRLPGEAGPVWDRHLKPADPQFIRVEVRRRF